MIAIQFRKSIPRYLALRAFGRRWPALYTSAISPVALRRLDAPALPMTDWVRVRPRLSGICGSDLATICAKGSAYLSPLTSTPFVLGHEVVGTVTELGPSVVDLSLGQRVVIQPALGCRVRGIEPPCQACAEQHPALCRNMTRGCISAGIQTGYCRDTGGGWSEGLVAHRSQVLPVPDRIDDAEAVLTEPLACALHAVLRARPKPGATVLVMGCGTIGLLTIAALRFLSQPGQRTSGAADTGRAPIRIVVVSKHLHQRDHAAALGADEVVMYAGDVGERYNRLASVLGADRHQPEIGKPTIVGGADVTFDCVASSVSIDDCCRFTAAGGDMVLVGMPGIPSGIDWTAIWYKELSVHAAYAYGLENLNQQSVTTFDLAIDLLAQHGPALRRLVGTPFALGGYLDAIRTALNTGRSRSVKTVFRIESDRTSAAKRRSI